MAVRSGALNLFRKNSLKQQIADIQKAMKNGGVLSLSEVHRAPQLEAWAKKNGYGFVASKGDTAILYDASRFDVEKSGSHTLNKTEGPTGGMRSREAAYALLIDKKTGKKFWQISAHTTPPKQGPPALRKKIREEQYRSIAQLAQRLRKETGTPVLLAGDLNFRNPNIKGFESGFDGGIMHVAGMGASAVNLDRIHDKNLNSDHSAVFTNYRLDGGGRDKVNLQADDRNAQMARGGGGKGPKAKGGSGKGKGGDGPNVKDWAADYGWSYAFLKDHPHLKKIFDQAVQNNWSPQRFVAEIQDTPWFKKHADTWRQAVYLQATDPKTYQQRVSQIRDQLRDAAGNLGIEVSGRLLNKWAEQAIRFGWTDAQIHNHLASQVKIMGENTVGGELASTQDSLNNWAMNNGVKINQKTMQNWLRAIVRGDSTFEEYKQYITKQAIAAHPNWAQELKGGMSVADLAEPYRNMAAQLLEMSPKDIDLNGPLLRGALSYKKDDGSYDAMSMYDFEDRLRKDPRWLKTDNAKESMMNTGSAVLRMFGVST